MSRKFEGDEIVFASHNKGKVKEIGEMFAGHGIKVTSAADYGLDSPPETEDSFIGNALIKARYVSEKTGKPVLSDDSGFCVDALNGAPGVYSADWAETDTGRDFIKAMKRVNDEIGDNPNKTAHFVTCLVLFWPDGHYETAEGRVTGKVTWPLKGDMGFGYDPMFVPEGFDKTFAEISSEDKNKISHRGRAFEALMQKCFGN